VLVGNVIGESSLSTRLPTSSTGLQVKFLTSCLQFINGVFSPSRKINVDRCPHASTKVGGAGVDVAVPLIQAEVFARLLLDRFLNTLDSLSQPGKNFPDITTHLHGDNTKLVLFIDPDQECFLVIVEDSTSLGPIPLHASNGKVSVPRNKQEVVVHKLLTNSFIHACQRVVISRKILGEVLNSRLHQLFNTQALIFGDSRGKTKSINGTANTNSAGVDWSIFNNVALDFADIHVRGMLSRSADSMIFLDKGIKDRSKVLVGVPITSIDTTVLVVEFNSTCNGLNQCEARCLGLDVFELLPDIFGDMLCNQ